MAQMYVFLVFYPNLLSQTHTSVGNGKGKQGHVAKSVINDSTATLIVVKAIESM